MLKIHIAGRARWTVAAALGIALQAGHFAASQEVPFISGGAGFVTITNGGNTTYIPVVEPLFMASLGKHLAVETRATLLESIFPRSGKGYDHSAFLGLSYLQAD